jgi:hypothetical protein
MNFLSRIFQSTFFIKLRHWEFWPFGIVQAPFFIYWFWLSIKARSFFFFSASNPSIFSGGMMGESKFEVLDLVPQSHRPKAVLIKLPSTLHELKSKMNNAGLLYPAIFKPDLGERGWMVRKIHNDEEAQQYLSEIKIEFIIQEFLDLPLEFGVFYSRHPKEEIGNVISITSKEMLSVTGNGKDKLEQLIDKDPRAKLQAERLKKIFIKEWNEVMEPNRKVELNTIGNHCLGTKFLDGNHLITPRLQNSFDELSKKINGFYFGRYDLRCATLQDLENGNVMIMELNGCGAEPSHIYQPGFSLWSALGVLYTHWKTMYEISVENHKRGVAYVSFSEGMKTYRRVRSVFGKE